MQHSSLRFLCNFMQRWCPRVIPVLVPHPPTFFFFVLVRVPSQVAPLMFFSSFLVDIIMKALTQHIKNAISGQIRVLLECFLQWLMEANTAAIKRKQNGKMKREWDGFFPAQGNKSERADVRPKWKQSCDARKLCYHKWLTKKILPDMKIQSAALQKKI